MCTADGVQAEKKDTDTQEEGTTYTSVDDFLQQNDLSAIKDHLPPGAFHVHQSKHALNLQ